MCIDPPGQRLPRYAVCNCGDYFPKCDLEDAKNHNINGGKPGVLKHTWTLIHEDWIELLNPVRPPSA